MIVARTIAMDFLFTAYDKYVTILYRIHDYRYAFTLF